MFVTGRRQTLSKQTYVEFKRPAKFRALKVANAAIIAQHLRARLQRENRWLLPFVRWDQDGVAIRADLAFDLTHGGKPFVPSLRRFLKPGLLQNVCAIKQDPRVTVPRNAVQMISHLVRFPQPREIVRGLNLLGCGDVTIQWLQRVECRELRNPSIA